MKTLIAIILMCCMLSGCFWTSPLSGIQYDITDCGCDVRVVGFKDTTTTKASGIPSP